MIETLSQDSSLKTFIDTIHIYTSLYIYIYLSCVLSTVFTVLMNAWMNLRSGLWTWHLTVSNEDLRPICLHWCGEISAPSNYWFFALYKYSLCTDVCMYAYMYVCLPLADCESRMIPCSLLCRDVILALFCCSLERHVTLINVCARAFSLVHC